MVVCPQCSTQYDAGEEFCRKCGSFLLTDVEPGPEEEQTKVVLTCPKCQAFYKRGNYCKRCGSLLGPATPFQELTAQRSRTKLIKRRTKEHARLFEQKRELELCLSKLDKSRNRIPGDVFDPLFRRYQEQLKELSSLQQEIESENEAIKRMASEEIVLLEKELNPLRKRLAEFQSLYQLGAITKADFLREKNETQKEIGSRERTLNRDRQILSLLSAKMGGTVISPGLARTLLRPFILLTASLIVILVGAGGYFLWGWHSQSGKEIPRENITLGSNPLSPNASVDDQEVGDIRSLFENIRQANLQKDISLFMDCYSRDFRGREGKRLDTLETWKHVNYLDLSYALKKHAISGNSADVTLQWLMKTIPKAGGPLQENRIILQITLKKEDTRWKIRDVKTVG